MSMNMQTAKDKGQKYRNAAGFTLIETLVAVSFLTLAIISPMTLA